MVSNDRPVGSSTAIARTAFRPNPIRHSRASLGFSRPDTERRGGGRGVASISSMLRPGGASVHGGDRADTCRVAGDGTVVQGDVFGETPGCRASQRPTRYASTNISKDYSVSTAEYLKRRGRSYVQNDRPYEIRTDTANGTDAKVCHEYGYKNHKYGVAGAVTSSTRIHTVREAAVRHPNVVNLAPPFVRNEAAVCCTK